LLKSRRLLESKIVKAPFHLFYVDRYLDDSVVEDLCRHYPIDLVHTQAENKKSFSMGSFGSTRRALEDNPVWKRFLDYVYSAAFLNECVQYLSVHSSLKLRKNVARVIKGNVLSRCQFTVDVEFSRIEVGGSIVPHTDAVQKMLSLMLYFPTEAQAGQPELGTNFWAKKKSLSVGSWSLLGAHKVSEASQAEFYANNQIIHQTEYVKNRLYGFIRSPRSWHSVSVLQMPDGMPRRSLNINIYFDNR
jgi:hypothetical protein